MCRLRPDDNAVYLRAGESATRQPHAPVLACVRTLAPPQTRERSHAARTARYARPHRRCRRRHPSHPAQCHAESRGRLRTGSSAVRPPKV
eukprot:7377292-Prymnesium_polylepis.1